MPYKMFNKDLTCLGFQYKEGKTYKLPKNENLEICESGFHYCENPLDCLNYYDLLDKDCNINPMCEVTPLGTIKTNEEKSVTDKIKIGARLSLGQFIKASFEFIKEKVKAPATPVTNEKAVATSGDYSKVATSGNSSQVATSGDYSKVATSGDYSKVATSGNYSKVATSGNSSQVATSGYYSQVATSGNSSQVATSGDYSQVATSGDYSQVATSGYYSQVATSGNSSQVATSGDYSQVATSGDYSKVATSGNSSQVATSGDYSKVATSGNSSQVATSGDYSKVATSGNSSQVIATGKNSIIANIGRKGMAKGVKGTWITLAEYKYDKRKKAYIPMYVKAFKVDGKKIKENTFYTLENKKLTEVK